jgi:hypothetical protein
MGVYFDMGDRSSVGWLGGGVAITRSRAQTRPALGR